MVTGLSERRYGAADSNPRRQRTHHTRARTGCTTCRIRRVRCDEQKPSCNRCVSTGRTCDGYTDNTQLLGPPQSSGAPSHGRLQMQRQDLVTTLEHPRALLPRNNHQELRSYHFFLHVTAPAIASVFDVDFWLTDIPRTCHLDPAIWHAAVSLGAVHESCIASQGASQEPTAFSLQQMNAVVRHLVHLPSSRTVLEERSRALIASVLFIYLYSIQGLYAQSTIHLEAAKNLIKEIEGHNARRPRSETAQLSGPNAAFNMKPLLSVVASLDVYSQAIQNGGVNVAPAFLKDADPYTAWRYYTAPAPAGSSTLCRHGKCVPSRATPANLARAGRAFESLLSALVTLSQQNSPEVARLVLEAEDDLILTLKHRQGPHARAFGELDLAITMFTMDTASDMCLCFGLAANPAPTTQRRQKKAIDTLRLYHATCYPILFDKTPYHSPPTDGSPSPEIYHPLVLYGKTPVSNSLGSNTISHLDPQAALAGHVARTLDIAESVLRDESPPARLADASDFTPVLPTTQTLFIIAHISGLALALRRRTIALLRRYPRREGLYDSLFAAALAELSMREECMLQAVRARDGGDERAWARRGEQGGEGEREGSGDKDEEGEEAVSVPPIASKLYSAAATFTGSRSARVVMQTWADWVAGKPGREVALIW
ncbi:hypothetical protein B0H63DRAFT_560297 [Podospora didyma]|uniref:Zn(2)-C6 fungal-type domain-containing protein n=1 Tax=Podospora didyma TaxID=330526 RepID=A0AAE0NQF1_9PEZI|nr:hypothetical protein B0H63DRAFT_560297 [Podospora didyma]